MKKIFFLLLLIITFNSCSVDENSDMTFALVPIESVVLPSTFTVNESNTIILRYRRPTTCHIFNGIYYRALDNNVRTVGIEMAIYQHSNCTDATDEGPYEVNLEFKPTELGFYYFKFFNGINSNGEEIFIEYEVEVN